MWEDIEKATEGLGSLTVSVFSLMVDGAQE